MPVYEYVCESCNERFEIKQKFTDDPLNICPRCSGSIHRVIQPAKIVFKGSGFYVTDHGNNNHNGQLKKNDSKPAAESADAKPATGESSSTTNTTTTTETAKPAKPEPTAAS
jgi:putative FmdB family regulatory protein